MNEVNYIIQEEGENVQWVVHVNMIKPFYRKDKVVLFAMKEGDNEKHELPYWEGWGEHQYNPEDVKICDTLTPEWKEEARALLWKYKQVFLNKPGVAKGVVYKIDTRDASLRWSQHAEWQIHM